MKVSFRVRHLPLHYKELIKKVIFGHPDLPRAVVLNLSWHRRSQRGPKGPCPPQMFRKYSHFVLWEAFFQTKWCYLPKFNHFVPPIFFPPSKFLGWLRHCFMVCGALPKTLNTCDPCSSTGFCNITAELFSKGLCWWPPENRSV